MIFIYDAYYFKRQYISKIERNAYTLIQNNRVIDMRKINSHWIIEIEYDSYIEN